MVSASLLTQPMVSDPSVLNMLFKMIEAVSTDISVSMSSGSPRRAAASQRSRNHAPSSTMTGRYVSAARGVKNGAISLRCRRHNAPLLPTSPSPRMNLRTSP